MENKKNKENIKNTKTGIKQDHIFRPKRITIKVHLLDEERKSCFVN